MSSKHFPIQNAIRDQRAMFNMDTVSTDRLVAVARHYHAANLVQSDGPHGAQNYRDAMAFGLAAAQVLAERMIPDAARYWLRTPASFWTYQASEPTPTVDDLPPGTFAGTQAEFEKLSPGMRREIARSARKRTQ